MPASYKWKLNLRDLGNIGSDQVPKGMFLRSGKLSTLSEETCSALCKHYDIRCVIDLRTPLEIAESPDVLPEWVDYQQIPIVKGATAGITHETGTNPVTITRQLRHNPEKLKAMIPDLNDLYKDFVTDEYCRSQIDKAVSTLKQNAANGVCTLFHCTAGKDRTGIVTMALLKSYGVDDNIIVKDYMTTNRYAFLPTLKKCFGIGLLTRNWGLVTKIYKIFMADRKLIETAIRLWDQ